MTGLTLDIESVLSSISSLDNEGLSPPLKGIKTFSVLFGGFKVRFELFVSVVSVAKVAAMMSHDLLILLEGVLLENNNPLQANPNNVLSQNFAITSR